jgi:hypothetical protein
MAETTDTMETTKATEPIEAKSEYQHFIPQFILREFAETPTTAAAAAAGEGSAGTGAAAKRRNRRWNNKKRGGGKKRASGEGSSSDGRVSAVDRAAKTMEGMGLGEDDGGEVGRRVAKKEECEAGNADTRR